MIIPINKISRFELFASLSASGVIVRICKSITIYILLTDQEIKYWINSVTVIRLLIVEIHKIGLIRSHTNARAKMAECNQTEILLNVPSSTAARYVLI